MAGITENKLLDGYLGILTGGSINGAFISTIDGAIIVWYYLTWEDGAPTERRADAERIQVRKFRVAEPAITIGLAQRLRQSQKDTVKLAEIELQKWRQS